MSFFDDASLAFLPSGAAGKDGKAYSIKPTDGTGDFTFSRGSNLAATRVGADGLIEKGRENLLTQSNNFTAWNLDNATSGHAGYDGTNDAWLQSGTSRLQRNITLSSSVYTGSIYVKAGFSDYAQLYLVGSSNALARFQLTGSGTIVNSGGISPKIEPVSGATGWYRISTNLNGSIDTFRVYPQNDSSGTQTADSSIYIQDAQLEIGLAATDVIETGATTGKAGLLEDEPRFDYSGGATCPSLLLEPSRTNLIKYSEYFEGTGWIISTNNQKVSSNNLSPSGELNAYKFKSINITGSTFTRFSVAVADNTDYTFSCYARSDNPSALTTGKLLQLQMSGGGQITSISSTLVTSEWQRFDITATSGVSSAAYCYLGVDWDVDAEIEFWGAQIEQGSYPTSYIPNHSGTGSVTRGVDSCTGAGDVNTFNSTEGVLYFEAKTDNTQVGSISINDGTSSNRITARFRADINKIQLSVIGSTDDFNLNSDTITISDYNKIAIVYNNGDYYFFVNGIKGNVESKGTFLANTFTQLDFNRGGGSEVFAGNSKQILYFNEALSDADLTTLTT